MKSLAIIIMLSSAAPAAFAQEPPVGPQPRALLEGQVFGSFAAVKTAAQSENAFELGRAESGLWLSPLPWAGAELRLEAIRSAGPESVTGIDGDSLVVRVKRAWGFARTDLGSVNLEARAGLIPDVWIDALEWDYPFRGVSATLGERAGFFDTSDLGAGFVVRAPYVRVAAAMQNGEGRNQIEQNKAKNLTAAASAHLPIGSLLAGAHVAARYGSIGPGDGKAHRLSGALTLQHLYGSGGVEVIDAIGIRNVPAQTSLGLGVWGSGYLPKVHTGLFVRADYVNQATGIANDHESRFLAALYVDGIDWRFDRQLRLYVGGMVERFGDNAAPIAGVPAAVDARSLFVTIAVTGAATLQ